MAESPDLLSIRERDGVRWIEARIGDCLVRFTFGFDGSGVPVDLGFSADRPNREARLRVARALGLDPGRVLTIRQVHGDRIVEANGESARSVGGFLGPGPPESEADGLLLRKTGWTAAVQVADCLPIAIAGSRGCVLLHCGWRGLSTTMLERAVAMVEGREAVIGPSIGSCCYEVGPEVAEALSIERSPNGSIDLQASAQSRLRAAGVGEVYETGLCTCCGEQQFFSYRRQGASAGRQMAFLDRT